MEYVTGLNINQQIILSNRIVFKTQPDCNTHRVTAAVPEIKNLQALEGKEKGGEGGRKGTCALKMISLVSLSQNVSILNYQRWGRRGGGEVPITSSPKSLLQNRISWKPVMFHKFEN